jgi:hypothetical protein
MNSASLCSLAGRYDNPLIPRFIAPIASLKIPALAGQTDNPLPTQFLAPIDRLKIPALLSFISEIPARENVHLTVDTEEQEKGRIV